VPLRFTAAEIGRRFDALAPDYDRLEWLVEVAALHRLRRQVFRQAHGDVLEVAAGTGKNLPWYPPGCRITAIDVSGGMLTRARERARALGLQVSFARMDAEALAFPDHSFDTVASSLSTCTFPDPVAALREMGRVCRPGGRILLLEHGRSRWAWISRLQDRYEDVQARQLCCHWNRAPDELLRAAGLTLVKDRRTLAGVIHQIVAAP
jgi:ubiquinone/menaquinone biosynthesis C-methylase UbiE